MEMAEARVPSLDATTGTEPSAVQQISHLGLEIFESITARLARA